MRDITTKIRQLQMLQRGQALIEYALILVLVGLAFGFALAATGPAIGNVFSTTVYNLLGQEDELREVFGPGDFWLTVTHVAANPLEDVPIPTRTLPPPSSTPTPGPSPTPTEVIPTEPPPPTSTPRPTNTPDDFAFEAPHLDTVDDPIHWRVNAEPFLGSSDWRGEYYEGMNLDRDGALPAYIKWNRELGPEFRNRINFNWGNGGPLDDAVQGGWLIDQFSIRYTRQIYVPDTITITFNVQADDGVRLWLLAPGQSASNCSATNATSGGNSTGRNIYGDDHGQHSTDCLLLDDWRDGAANGGTVTRTITGLPDDYYTLQLDYYENGGGAYVRMNYGISPNVDDVSLDGSGVNCNWGQSDLDRDANSPTFMWKEYASNDRDIFPRNMRCHLEFRGYVEVPDTMQRPEFVFWDAWDMAGNSQRGWLEIAEYIPNTEGPGLTLNRDAINWIPINLHQGATTNYNWTRRAIDLTNVNGTNFSGRKVTFRFVMENGNQTGNRRWYIDDIEFQDGGVDEFGPGTRFELNQPGAADQFITSPLWSLTSTNSLPNPDTGNCCSWELYPGETYPRFGTRSGSLNRYDPRNMRAHYVELNGWVDYSGGQPDDQGNEGNPMLSFYHGYHIGSRTGLEVQYTTDPFNTLQPNWQPIPGISAGDPYGRLIDAGSNTSNHNEIALRPVSISLNEIPATRYRLRFVLYAADNATQRDGWWIDDIYLHREGRPRYLDYPFADAAEAGMGNWLPSGQWSRTTDRSYTGSHSFADSPDGNYIARSDTTLRFIYPIDFANNSPDNLDLDDRNPSGGNSGGAAIDPVMTFWHQRDLNNANFHVEWRRWDESDQDWKRLWSYDQFMNTNPTTFNTRMRRQHAWEFVHIELEPILRTFDAGDTDSSDIMIRFRLESLGSQTAGGLHIDDIRIQERQQQAAFRLWPSSENRTIGGQNFGTGNNVRYGADVDEADWFMRWRASGNWQAITWEQYSGLRSWHESADEQSSAPFVSNDNRTRTQPQTFNTLELARVFDLRGTLASERPTLYFWSRYHIGWSDRISVQISERLPEMTPEQMDAEMANRCNAADLPQCYEQHRGWSAWRDVGFEVGDSESMHYTWQRYQISLIPFAASGNTPGREIRVRFVFDALEHNQSSKRDGWYIDSVSLGPRQDVLLTRIADGGFFDGASNLSNWVTEGRWGLDPEYFRGSGGGPASLGTWTETWWRFNACPGTNRNNLGNWLLNRPIGQELTDLGNCTVANTSVFQRIVGNINYDFRTGGPNWQDGSNWVDWFTGRWTLETPVVGPTSGILPGEYTFITVSDDGVRLRGEEIDAQGNVIDPRPMNQRWIIMNWTDHGRTADMGTFTMEAGKRYRFVLEYYEATGNAIIALSVGGTNFSFADTPKQGAGPAFPDAPALPRGNSSLILNGTLDLNDAREPVVLQYYTYYHLNNNNGTARVEISIDGGFSWTSNSLNWNYVHDFGLVETFDSPTYGGNHSINQGDWQLRRHNLTNFRDGAPIMVRFRLDRLGTNNQYTGSLPAGWWITDITISGS